MSFLDEIQGYRYEEVLSRIMAKNTEDVQRALLSERLRIDDFMALLSPAAGPFIEKMALKSHRLTLQRFGNTILMYAPLYLSNVCTNGCRYCGFNATNRAHRQTLTLDEIEQEATIIHNRGFRHILLVTGEATHVAGNDYIVAASAAIWGISSALSPSRSIPWTNQDIARWWQQEWMV